MKFSLETITDKNYIQSYGDNHIDVKTGNASGLTRLDSDVVISPNNIIRDWHLSGPSTLTTEQVSTIKKLEPELLIYVINATTSANASEVIAQITSAEIGLECMALGAACRTYNLLITEERKVVMVVNF